ncbi:Uma2 family endonuclease [Nodosilinea sp. LEGE 06152]|uniref:Uma2 family endonuclease n=1 Tax=Nodosilinea sp. LEGE 06152 TaxID=2777966 RepID=UPI00187DE9EF|nr:Uma2 family endonuclease [Nodosilinea sp. LEGE 06152]MBE9159759.1 Uma2 family endonuclease [Nodosilinea sp. LEGE 06152]
MVATKLSLADFLSLETDSDARCEFVDGDVIEMPPESSRNVLVSLFLLQQLLQVLPLHWLRRMDTEIVVSGRVRIPDLLVLGEDLAALLEDTGRSTITEDMPSPLLVVEVVSPGKVNEDRDYRYKRSEYAARGIPEYWIVDPAKAVVTVLTLVDGLYEAQELQGEALLRSPQFPGLSLTTAKLLSPKGTVL